jgi:UDP-N-acetylmuramyl pentapeptide phosphotransferase/UDP-N-acetylglucosamine-1-phosphate transferase
VSWPQIAATAVAAYAVTLPLVFGARWLALRAGIVDHPNARSSHHQPVPRGGGVAIVVAALGLLALIRWQFPGLMQGYSSGVAAGAILVAAISGADDCKGLPASLRLLIHVIAAMVAWRSTGLEIDVWAGDGSRLAIGIFATVWIAGMINAYNFMDGIDGIAGSVGVVAGLAWAIIGLMTHQSDVAAAGATASGACAAFLMLNWAPASVFMGDVGSAFLGYWFAVLAILAARHDRFALVQGALIMWPFIFDTVTTMLRRIVRGENPLHAHRTHLYQRLIATGLGHASVASLYALLAVTGACAAILAAWRPQLLAAWLLIPTAGAVANWVLVIKRERSIAVAGRSRT